MLPRGDATTNKRSTSEASRFPLVTGARPRLELEARVQSPHREVTAASGTVSLSAQSALHRSLTLLLRYRSDDNAVARQASNCRISFTLYSQTTLLQRSIGAHRRSRALSPSRTARHGAGHPASNCTIPGIRLLAESCEASAGQPLLRTRWGNRSLKERAESTANQTHDSG